ncbi:LegC family aminotransferase [Desulforamulus putei]|uniref:Perosamine synthetase n=1 Tax=Desulforamulus putei DSM 12395 TaxID=1121429 RepID=A0A1M5AY53_9FIRM|nr:LegC family aminotransferase [Desulforamulus putei]SHF35133.1 perosamine synthetase [Desulforamulus putei DSM 12395]
MDSNSLVEQIINAIKSVLPAAEQIALHEPCFVGNEWAYVKDCLDSGWVSSVGGYVTRFEQMLAEYTGAGYAVVTVNGTAALHICLQLAGVQPGDEVLMPALTFVATANAVCYCGAQPHFVDNAPDTLGVDPVKLGDYLQEIAQLKDSCCYNRLTGRRIAVLLPVHTFGHPVDLDPLQELCQHYHLVLVEDAAEALGSLYKGRHVGTFGLLSALSFNGNKIITTGGGGAILTNDPELARLAKHLTTTAKLPHAWKFYHDRLGYNYRLPNINAALGCAQLEKLPEFLAKKRALAEKYQAALAGVPGVSFFTEPPFARSNYWLNALLLDEEWASLRDTLLAETHRLGIQTRPVWRLMPELPMYEGCPQRQLIVAKSLQRRIINLPSSSHL